MEPRPIEPQQPDAPQPPRKFWHDDNPFYLLIILADGRYVEQDLGEPGWIDRMNPTGVMRAPGVWHLVRKDSSSIVLMVEVAEGEQPYYLVRHAGFATKDQNIENKAYGIGKKRLDGHVDRLWILSNGCVVGGDDVDTIIVRLLKQGFLPDW